MKALVKSRDKRGLWLDDIPEPTAGINDVLVRVHYTGRLGEEDDPCADGYWGKLRSSAFPLGHVDGLAAGRLQYAHD